MLVKDFLTLWLFRDEVLSSSLVKYTGDLGSSTILRLCEPCHPLLRLPVGFPPVHISAVPLVFLLALSEKVQKAPTTHMQRGHPIYMSFCLVNMSIQATHTCDVLVCCDSGASCASSRLSSEELGVTIDTSDCMILESI